MVQGNLQIESGHKNPGNSVMYYLCRPLNGASPAGSPGDLRDGPEQTFISDELILIPEDTELPPDYVQEW